MHIEQRSMVRKHWKIGLVLLVALFTAGWNMFHFPYYENDEGVYLSQAWSLLHEGKLAPYTYWYDHAPAGWILTAVWLFLTRSVFAFGFSINSGRMLMLVVHMVACGLLLYIGKRLTGRQAAGVIAVLIFSLSPLGIYFQRRMLLDNLMMVWMLGAFAVLLKEKVRISHVAVSGLMLGIGILTKENALFFIPGFLITFFFLAHRKTRLLWSGVWLLTVGGIVACYILYALLKGEFFATGTLLGGNLPHVSLMQTLQYQSGRVAGDSLAQSFAKWVRNDSFLMYGGIGASVALIGMAIWRKKYTYLGIVAWIGCFWAFLARGGIVIEFYVLPLIPLYALAMGLIVANLPTRFLKRYAGIGGVILVCLWYGRVYISQHSFGLESQSDGYYLFAANQTGGQQQAVDYIRTYVPTDAVITIDNYSYLEFHDKDNPSGKIYPYAHWYWKIDGDPEIRDQLLQNDPARIGYIARTPQMDGDMKTGVAPLAIEALRHASMVRSFRTDGWEVELWATNYTNQVLRRTWDGYVKEFVSLEGQVLDPAQKGGVTSEGQSYALLRAVYMNDKATFDRVWKWTKKEMQLPAGTFAWKWNNGAVIDNGSAADADTDMALALLFAGKRWKTSSYINEAKQVLDGLWTTEVVQLSDTRPVLVAGNWAGGAQELTLNPSYFAPYAYRIFGEADHSHPWERLVGTSYELLDACTSATLDQPKGLLPPNWCGLTRDGQIVQPSQSGVQSSAYSYDALRTPWRVAVDAAWNNEPQANALLLRWGQFLADQWNKNGKMVVGYEHDGDVSDDYESAFAYALNIQAIKYVSPFIGSEIFDQKVMAKMYQSTEEPYAPYWEDSKNYYTQNWVWFGTALYTNNLPNLWK